jgi:integrase
MAQKLRKVERNLYIDEDTGIFHVRAMINGKARGPITTGHTTLKMALRKRDDIMSDLRKRAEEKQEVPTLGTYWKDYRKRKNKSEETWKKQQRMMDLHLLDPFGTTRLNDFTPSKMEFHIQRRKHEGASQSTIALELKVIIAILNDAWENGVIDRNPLRKILKDRKAPRIAIRKRVLTDDEQDRLLATALPETRRYILFLLATGVRLEEAVKLTAADFDWDRREFKVVGKYSKTRQVPILAPVLLKHLVDEQLAMTGTERLWTRDYVAMRQVIVWAAKVAGVGKIGSHTMRHTFATRYLTREGKNGRRGDIYTLSLILGHSSVKTTERHYAHLLSENLVDRSTDVEVGVEYRGAKG